MRERLIKIYALILALAMTISFAGCGKKEDKSLSAKDCISIVAALNNREVANMTNLDEEIREGKDSVIVTTQLVNDEELTITDAFDRVIKCIDILERIPDLSDYKMGEANNPIVGSDMEELISLDLSEIDKLIEEARYTGKEYNLVEKAQIARQKLYALKCYAIGWLNRNGYKVSKNFLATLLRSSVAAEFGVEIKDVNFGMTPYMETEDNDDFTENGILTIHVNKDGETIKFEITEKPGDPLFEVARSFSKAEYYAPIKNHLDEEDYQRLLTYYQSAETLLTRGVNLSDGKLVPQNSEDYAKGILG